MKKRELQKLEELKQERKLNKEAKNKIAEKALNNFLIALDILLLFIILIITAKKLPKDITLIVYKISSMIFLVLTLVIFEIAYKKDNDELAVTGIEVLFLSISTLLTPYYFIERPTIFTSVVGAYFTAYYILKNLYVYKKEKKLFLRQQNDINQIIKKESQDELAIEEKEKLANKTLNKEVSKEEPKRKRGRPRKIMK